MDFGLNKINKKITFCTMCFNLGMEKFAKMRNDSTRNSYQEYYLKPLIILCKNFKNLVVYCDKEAEEFLYENLTKEQMPIVKVFKSFRELHYFDKEETFKHITKNVYETYPQHKDDFSLYSLNRKETDYQAIYSLLVLNKIFILQEISKINPYNSDYFAWIDSGCFQDKYSKFWEGWKNELKINTKKFKCCVNIKNGTFPCNYLNLDVASIILKPTETIEAIAPFFYIHRLFLEKFYKEYNEAIEYIISLKLPCTEQAVWTYMLLNKKTRNLFYPIACDDYKKVISLVASETKMLSFSRLDMYKTKLIELLGEIMNNIFDVKNVDGHKIFTILGIKLKFKRKIKKTNEIDIKKIEKDICKKFEKILCLPDTLEQVEINLTSHCNLNCQMCDHFSPIAKKEFADIDIVSRDLKRLAELTNANLKRLLLLGGEPLLNPNINSFIEIARKYFPNTDVIVFTNCILLDKMSEDFWQACKEYNATITYTKYPIKLDFEKLKTKADYYGVKFEVAGYQEEKIKTSWKFPLDLSGKQDKLYNYINCIHATKCLNLENGKMYTCTVAPNIRHFNEYFNKQIPLTEEDGVDIFKVSNLKELIRRLHKPIPFCKYCNIDGRLEDLPFKISKKSIEEWT